MLSALRFDAKRLPIYPVLVDSCYLNGMTDLLIGILFDAIIILFFEEVVFLGKLLTGGFHYAFCVYFVTANFWAYIFLFSFSFLFRFSIYHYFLFCVCKCRPCRFLNLDALQVVI